MTEQGKLGVGLCVGLGVPFLIAAPAAIFLWRRSLGRTAVAAGTGTAASDGKSPEYAPVPWYAYAHTQAHTQEAANPVQLEANNPRAELGDESSTRAELGGGE